MRPQQSGNVMLIDGYSTFSRTRPASPAVGIALPGGRTVRWRSFYATPSATALSTSCRCRDAQCAGTNHKIQLAWQTRRPQEGGYFETAVLAVIALLLHPVAGLVPTPRRPPDAENRHYRMDRHLIQRAIRGAAAEPIACRRASNARRQARCGAAAAWLREPRSVFRRLMSAPAVPAALPARDGSVGRCEWAAARAMAGKRPADLPACCA